MIDKTKIAEQWNNTQTLLKYNDRRGWRFITAFRSNKAKFVILSEQEAKDIIEKLQLKPVKFLQYTEYKTVEHIKKLVKLTALKIYQQKDYLHELEARLKAYKNA